MKKLFVLLAIVLFHQTVQSQNVGIGTSSPAAQLHLKYNSANTAIGTPVLILDNPAGGTHTSLQFQINGVETGRMRSSLSGSLTYSTSGTGNHIFKKGTDATELLIIHGSSGNLMINPANDNNGDVLNGALTFGLEGSGEGIASKRTAGINQFGLIFFTGYANRMTIASNGNIGMGTTSPTEKLDVNGKIKTTNLQVTNGALNGYVLQSDANGNASWVDPASAITETDPQVSSTAANYIPKWNGTTLGDGQIYDDGNAIGIGTSNPTGFGENFGFSHLMLATENINHTDLNNLYAGNDAYSPWLNWGKSRGSLASPSIVQNGDQLFFLTANGYDGTKYKYSAAISINVDGTPGENNMPSRISFSTTNEGASIYTEKMRITNTGNVGIGTTAPLTLLQVTGGNFYVTGSFGSSPVMPSVGNGVKMFFNPRKGAFRAGYNDNTQWHDANIGDYSIALGYSPQANGEKSVAIGNFASAGNTNATAIGNNASAGGTGSIALGNSASSGGDFAAALGSAAQAEASNSAALGSNIKASSFAEVVVGSYNTDYTPNSTSAWNTSDRLFVVGNGSSSGSKSNAMVILKNGNTGIGTATPTSLLHIYNASGGANINIQSGTTSASLNLTAGASGMESSIATHTNGSQRWSFGKSNGAESGSDVGSDFFINRYNDAGTFQGQPFIIKRSTGNIGIGGIGNPVQKLDVSGSINVSSSNGYYIGNAKVISINGSDNTLIGVNTGGAISSGSSNILVGKVTGELITTGNENTAMGHAALNSLVSGSHNVAIGFGAGLLATGINNTYLGHSAGAGNTGNGSVFVGYQAGQSEAAGNKLYIDNSGTTSPLIYGDFSKDSASINGSLTIEGALGLKVRTNLAAGTTNPNATAGIWIYSSGTGTIDLTVATGTDRVLVILNNTGASRTISSYRDLANTAQTSIANNVSLWLVYDGTDWRQIK